MNGSVPTTDPQQIDITGVDQRQAWLAGEVPAVQEVRPGIWSLPVIFPDSPLRYTYCYLVEDRDGPVLIDPGLRTDQGVAALTDAVLAAGYRLSDVAGVVITHAHMDHHGLSAAVLAESGGWMGMHNAEADMLADRTAHGVLDDTEDAAWLARYAVPAGRRNELRIGSLATDAIRGLAPATVRFSDDDFLPLRDHRVRVVWTPGHTPGHLCLHHEGEQLFFSGDHVLPRISPHIGLQPHRAPAPLGPYLHSLASVRQFDGSEVLPGHEWRFRGLAVRVDQLLAHHQRRCDEIVDQLGSSAGATAWDLTTRLTWSRGWTSIQGFMQRTALAETIAHLEHLKQLEQIAEIESGPIGDTRFVNVA